MSRDDAYFVDILESAKLALSYVFGKTWEDFDRDRKCQDAVILRIERIGEAARRVSAQTRAEYPQLEWGELTGSRYPVIQEYDRVDIGQAWDIVRNKLPALIDKLSKIVPTA